REVATKNRGWQGFALGRSRREGGPRGSPLRCGGGDRPRRELPAEAAAGGTGERGGADGGGPRVRGHGVGTHGAGDGCAAQGGLARGGVPRTAVPCIRRSLERVSRNRPVPFSTAGWLAVSDGAAPGSRGAQGSLPNARSASPRGHGGTGTAAPHDHRHRPGG